MRASRRTFIKNSLIATASVTTPSLQAFVPSSETYKSDTDYDVMGPEPFTRGIGIYPGEPDLYFGPSFVENGTTYRNLALNRPASQSSAYDYNLTAQLVTDGIVDTTLPRWISAWTSTQGTLSIEEREVLVDHWPAASTTLIGGKVAAWLELGGGTQQPEVDHIAIFAILPVRLPIDQISFTMSVSDDGYVWEEVGAVSAPTPIDGRYTFPPALVEGNNIFYPMIPLVRTCTSRFYRVQLAVSDALPDDPAIIWKLGQMEFYHGSKRQQIGGPYDFTSAWRSAGTDEEWVSVDLGAVCLFDRVTLHWICPPAESHLQISHDSIVWYTIHSQGPVDGHPNQIHLAAPASARHVRILMTRPASPNGYILSEFEVFGRGGRVPTPAAAPSMVDGRIKLAGGQWRLQRESQVKQEGEDISVLSFDDNAWIPATVPGTILTSYLNAEAIPDPNFGQNQLTISDSFFYADFWYRTSFHIPLTPTAQLQWLHFQGVDWKGKIFLNGILLGQIDGGFTRACFDVTKHVKLGAQNVLAVRILKNDTPGSCKQKTYDSPGVNGGALGEDNPTFHASIGWDWIPTIRGRNTGIWGEVFLQSTGVVTIENPTVLSTISQDRGAFIVVELELVNHSGTPVEGSVRGSFGDHQFEQLVTVPQSSRQRCKLHAIHIEVPKLWWPVGYGDPYLYDVRVSFTIGTVTSCVKTFKSGIRQMTASENGGKLRLFINGRRFIARGGNWGFAESMLRYRAREYDVAVRYHREMNFTMIRNWVGQVPDDAFYEACDRHGLVVWQDFWLANPWDGPIPRDNELFLANARDLLLRIRNHASIGLYVGRNEGYPPPELEKGLRSIIAEFHPDIHYIGSSADDLVSGHGPYQALSPDYYFEHSDSKLHSEIGMPNIPTLESVRLMMPEAAIWPQGLDWGLHDFCLHGAQGGSSFRSIIDETYGGASTASEWITLAQFVNYEGYRAMFEAQSRDRMGVLLWMSHPCWPSFVWQTYDFYFEPTAAYFGCKKASEPVHIQWNRATNFIEVVNLSGGELSALTAQLEIFNLDGKLKVSKAVTLDSHEDSVSPCLPMTVPPGLSSVHILRLQLSKGAEILSTNLYLRGTEEGNLRAIRTLPHVRLTTQTTAKRDGDRWLLKTTLHNSSTTPALMVRLQVVRETARDRILPAIYEDNYITLLPNEVRSIRTEVNHTDTRGQRPRMQIGGFNAS